MLLRVFKKHLLTNQWTKKVAGVVLDLFCLNLKDFFNCISLGKGRVQYTSTAITWYTEKTWKMGSDCAHNNCGTSEEQEYLPLVIFCT